METFLTVQESEAVSPKLMFSVHRNVQYPQIPFGTKRHKVSIHVSSKMSTSSTKTKCSK